MLTLASAAVAAASCLAVMHVLNEPPGPAPAIGPVALEPTDGAVEAAPPHPPEPVGEVAAPRAAEGEAQLLSELARAAEAQEQALRDAILRIAEDDALSLDARLQRFQEVVKNARVESPNLPGFDQRSMLAEVFLRMEPVQRELAALGPTARSRELAHIRRELGFGEDAIARLEALDERRETRWANGLAYMRERGRLEASFEGEALEGELRALREEYFAHEARTIEAEERDGFFRFERPRIYGRN
jgi:hypothetical protein